MAACGTSKRKLALENESHILTDVSNSQPLRLVWIALLNCHHDCKMLCECELSGSRADALAPKKRREFGLKPLLRAEKSRRMALHGNLKMKPTVGKSAETVRPGFACFKGKLRQTGAHCRHCPLRREPSGHPRNGCLLIKEISERDCTYSEECFL